MNPRTKAIKRIIIKPDTDFERINNIFQKKNILYQLCKICELKCLPSGK